MSNLEEDISNTILLERLLLEIKKEGEDIKKSVSKEIKEENKKLSDKLDKSVHHLEQKYKQLQNRCVNLDRQTRKNNILIYGLENCGKEDPIAVVLQLFHEVLQVDVSVYEINNIYQIKTGNKQAIKVEFVSFLKKNLILRNCNKLKGKNIYIVHDLCFEDRQDQKLLKKHLNLARGKQNFAQIRGRNLIVNNEKYTVEDLKNMERDDDILEAGENVVNENNKSHSEPATPLKLPTNIFFEDSLSQFTIKTPQSSQVINTQGQKENSPKEDHQNETSVKHPKENCSENKNTDQENLIENKSEEEQSKDSIVHAETEEDKKKTEKKDEQKKPKPRQNSTSSVGSKIVTRQKAKN